MPPFSYFNDFLPNEQFAMKYFPKHDMERRKSSLATERNVPRKVFRSDALRDSQILEKNKTMKSFE
jgi:hypothetical protein